MKTMNGNGRFPEKTPLYRQIMLVLAGAAAVLMVPLMAMQFSTQVDWDIFDFFIMGVLLVVAGLLYVAGSRAVKTTPQRWMVGAVVGILFLLTWAELAVGIFGTPFAGS